MIETERLILRDWREEDVEPFLRHTNTPAVMRWLGGVLPEDKVKERLRDRLMRWQAERGFTFWIVERKRDKEVLGFCGLKLADDEGSPVEGEHEIGWRLREDAWGQGYAKEAACATLDFAFERLYAPHVVSLTVAGNQPSWGLMERLGMTRRPDLDYDGPDWAETPVIVYRIERKEWLDRWG
jgi:RimJ/RimL family protein N-acetyltransferase